jgi:hypothetical protein
MPLHGEIEPKGPSQFEESWLHSHCSKKVIRGLRKDSNEGKNDV